VRNGYKGWKELTAREKREGPPSKNSRKSEFVKKKTREARWSGIFYLDVQVGGEGGVGPKSINEELGVLFEDPAFTAR